jgi:chromosome partitioning protein
LIIAVSNIKGGAGKTTTSIHLGQWYQQQGMSVVVADADPQGSAANWCRFLDIESFLEPDSGILVDRLLDLRETVDRIVVDCPGSEASIKDILDVADAILVPCLPSGLDLHATNQTLQLARRKQRVQQKQFSVLLFINRARKGTLLSNDVAEALRQQQEFTVAETTVYDRQVVANMPGQENTVWEFRDRAAKEAAHEFESLFTELETLLSARP